MTNLTDTLTDEERDILAAYVRTGDIAIVADEFGIDRGRLRRMLSYLCGFDIDTARARLNGDPITPPPAPDPVTVDDGQAEDAADAPVESILEPDETPAEPVPAVPPMTVDPLKWAEERVLKAWAAGLDNPTIAQSLGLQVSTLNTYKHTIFRKLGVKTIPDAVALAAALHLIDPADAVDADSGEPEPYELPPEQPINDAPGRTFHATVRRTKPTYTVNIRSARIGRTTTVAELRDFLTAIDHEGIPNHASITSNGNPIPGLEVDHLFTITDTP